MAVLVPIKSVIDPDIHVFPGKETGQVATTSTKRIIDPFSEVALEAALQLREQGFVERVDVVTIATDATATHQLRDALALGADQAIFMQAPIALTALDIAQALTQLIKEETYQLAILGKQSSDTEDSQVPAMLAGLLNWPQVLNISKLSWQAQGLIVEQGFNGHHQQLKIDLPAILSVDLALNTPRYARLPGIMQAKRQPIKQLNWQDFTFDEPLLQIHYDEITVPTARPPVRYYDNVEELATAIKTIMQEIS